MQMAAIVPRTLALRSAIGIARPRLVLGLVGIGVIAAAAAWQWNWLVAAGVAPLLLSAAPCAAMCGLGLCMHRMGGRTCAAAPSDTDAPREPQPSSSITQET